MKLLEFFSVPSIENQPQSKKDIKDKSDDKKEQMVNDVYWFILDHDRLHKKHFFSIARKINLENKKNGQVDRKKFTDCWMPMVKEGCMDFYETQKMQGDPKKIFTKEMLKTICERLADRHIQDIIKDEYQLGE